jgi:2-hydroxy-3-keto-5-methylthiopentenyl-1-phosphate phosphatase
MGRELGTTTDSTQGTPAAARQRLRARSLLRVWADFDGTVARDDVTDAVLRRFAAPEWESIEADWLAGRIDAAACMRRQIALVQASRAELDAFLDGLALDPGFEKFAAWCAEQATPLAVVSDGVDYFARRILSRHGLGEIPVFANRLVPDGAGWALAQPWAAAGCRAGSGVCKCAVAGPDDWAHRHFMVYVGDGRSDRCVAARADLLFAKDGLAAYCLERGFPFRAWTSFDDVRAALEVGT